MRSVTSYFNPTLYRKNLARFWPLWTAWTVLWAFLLPLNLLNEWRRYGGGSQDGLYRFYRDCLNLNGTLGEIMLIFGVVYAVLIVMAVFGYLFNHRAAATIHALPMRRETLFVTNYLSGLTFFAIPNAVVIGASALVELTTLPAELSAVAIPALWQGFWMSMGVILFFYSFAVFCAQFTGNILALPAFYGILNMLVVAMYTLCVEMAGQIFYGGWPLMGEPVWVELFTPVYAIANAVQWNYVSLNALWNSELQIPVFQELELSFADPALIAGYAAAGIVLAVLALLVYRRRHIETAGDVVSVKIVRPIFRTGVAVCAGLCGGIVTTAFFGWYSDEIPTIGFVFLWTVIGYFVAEMLLQKSFRVFKKAWKGCLVTAAVLALLVTGCFLDVFGVETWVPDAGKVEKATIHINSTYPYDDASSVSLDVEDGVEIEKIVNLHQAIIDDYKKHGERYFGEDHMYVRVNYIMDNGAEYYKRYDLVNIVQDDINKPGATTFLLDQFVNDPSVIERAYNLEQARDSRIVCTQLQNVVYPSGRFGSEEILEGAEEIWAAVQADFAAGNLGHRYLLDDHVRNTETYFTDLTLRFLLPEERNNGDEDLYYVKYVGDMPTVEVMETQESAYAWNWTMTVTLTPRAERTLAALEKYSDIGGAYDIALHE